MGHSHHIFAALNTQMAGRLEFRLVRLFGRRQVYWDGRVHFRVAHWRGHDYLLGWW